MLPDLKISMPRVRTITLLGLTLCVMSAVPPAHAQFTTSAVGNVPGGSADPVASGIAVQNTAVPVLNVVYRGNAGVRYARKVDFNGAWEIDSTMTGTPVGVTIAIPGSSPFDPQIALASTFAPDPWIQYATRSGSTWTYESILSRAASADTVLGVSAAISIAMYGGTPYVAYVLQRVGGSIELWAAHRVGPGNWTREWVRTANAAVGEGSFTSLNLRVNSSGTQFLAYDVNIPSQFGDVDHADLSQRTAAQSSWTHQTVASGQVVTCALSLLNDGSPMLAYEQAFQLYCGTPATGYTAVAPCGMQTNSLWMVTAGGTDPLLAYRSLYGDSLNFAWKSSGTWNYQPVCKLNDPNSWVALTFGYYNYGATRQPQIAFIDRATPDFGSVQIVRLASSSGSGSDGGGGGGGPKKMPEGRVMPVSQPAVATRLSIGVVRTVPGRMEFALQLPNAQAVGLALRDVQGRALRTVDLGPLSAGPHEVHIDSHGLPGGVYFVEARGKEGGTANTKVVLLR